jgi:hypothetical protein
MSDLETRKLVEGMLEATGGLRETDTPETLRERAEARDYWFVFDVATGRAWGLRGPFTPPITVGEDGGQATGVFDPADLADTYEGAALIAMTQPVPATHTIVQMRLFLDDVEIRRRNGHEGEAAE